MCSDRQPTPYPNSWYAATAALPNAYPTLADREQSRFDLVVIGAGLTGLSAALAAADAGWSVCVLEARRVMWGASGRNGGQLLTGWRKSPAWLQKPCSQNGAKLLFSLALDCKNYVRHMIAHHQIDCQWQAGAAEVATKPRHARSLQREAEQTEKLTGYPHFRWLNRQQTSDLLGSDRYHGAVIDDDAGHLHPLRYGLALAALAKKRGVAIYEQTPVLGLDHTEGNVRTVFGNVTGRAVFLAVNGMFDSYFDRFSTQVLAVRSTIAATEVLAPATLKTINRHQLAICDSSMIPIYFRFTPDHRLLIGATEQIGNRPPNPEPIRRRLASIYPSLASTRFDFLWSGQLGVTSSRIPQVTIQDRVWALSGFSGMGLALSALGALLIVPAMVGSKPEALGYLQQIRNLKVPQAFRLPLTAIALQWHRLRDYLF